VPTICYVVFANVGAPNELLTKEQTMPSTTSPIPVFGAALLGQTEKALNAILGASSPAPG